MKKNYYGSRCWVRKVLRTMRITVFLCFVSVLQVYALPSAGQGVGLNLKMKNSTLKEVLQKIEENSDYHFFYQSEDLSGKKLIDIDVEQKTVFEVLADVLPPLKLNYEVFDKYIAIRSINENFSQQEKTVSGLVTDGSGAPVPGVTVVIKGTVKGTITNMRGEYSLSNVSLNDVLVFSFVGMKTREVVVGDQSSINVTMEEMALGLDEVVVVGYGTQRKGELTVSVSQVKGKDLESIPSSSFMQLMGGRAAGVDVISTSDAPGAGNTIRIRGANSVNSDASPLYVIDGFPVIEESLSAGDAFSSNKIATRTDPLAMINPNDIETIEILKDAAATSIYGARGANGVILITTKTGRIGKSELNVTANFGIQTHAKLFDLMNATEFSEYLYDAYNRGGVDMANLGYDPSKKLAIPVDYDTDWVSEVLQVAKVQDYNVSFSGANETSKYSGSVGYLNNEGIVKANYYERFSARFNGDFKAWENRITVGLNTNLSYVDQNSHWGVTSSAYNRALQKAPNIPVRFPEGTQYAGYYSHSDVASEWDVLWGNGYGVNSSTSLNLQSPFEYIDHAKTPSNQARMLANTYVSFEPVKGLILKASGGADLNYSKSKFLNQSEGPFRIANGDLQHDQSQSYSWLTENTLTYSGEIGKHSFTALLGQSAQKYLQEGLGWWVQEQVAGEVLVANNPFFVDGWFFDTGVEDHMTSNHKYATTSDYTVESYFGRFNYSYDGKYLMTATVRKDGSSKFGEDSKWGTFPGVSLAWNMHKEDFFNVSFVDMLKIRGSWGIVGNGNIQSYLSQSLLVKRPSFLVGAVVDGTATYEQGLVDPGLSWESTRQVDFGFDASIFKRWSITSDVYFKKTYDLLYPLTLPQSTGFSSIAMTNLGTINQFGIELSISGDIIKAKSKEGFNWFGSLNMDHLQGKVTELPPNVEYVGGNIRSYLNEPIGKIYGYKVDGIYNTQAELDSPDNPYSNAQLGDYRYMDIGSTDENGNYVMVPDGNITAADRTDLGSSVPVIGLGFQNTLSFRNFDLGLFFRSSLGNKVYNQARRTMLAGDGKYNSLKEAVNRWTPDNHSQTIQAANSNRSNPTGTAPLDIFVEDGSYLRLSNVNLGYTLPRHIIDHIGIKSLRVYGSINNAFVITGYSGLDPEISGGDVLVPRGIDTTTYPKTRTFSLGLNIGF